MSEKTLQEQLEEVEAELRNEHQRGALMDSGKVEDLAVRRQELNAQISAQAQAEREQAIEQKVHNEAVSFAIEGVDFQELPAALITIIEKVVKADRRRIYAEHAVELEQVEKDREAFKLDYNESEAEYAELEEKYEKKVQELEERTKEVALLTAERDDARTNRDNAAALLKEANQEIDRLKDQVEEYQKAKVFGERQAQAVIDVTPNEVDEINEAIKLFVKSENWGSREKLYLPDGSFKVVKRDELPEWTAITPPPMLGGGETATETFQGEGIKTDVEIGRVLASEVPSLDFRIKEESNGSGLPLDANGTVRSDDAPATWKELQALEARIEKRLSWLEQQTAVVA